MIQHRGAKSKSTVKLKELPQGALEPLSNTAEQDEEEPTYPTVIRQARSNMRKFENCVLLTRVGSFYEVVLSSLVDYIVLTVAAALF